MPQELERLIKIMQKLNNQVISETSTKLFRKDSKNEVGYNAKQKLLSSIALCCKDIDESLDLAINHIEEFKKLE